MVQQVHHPEAGTLRLNRLLDLGAAGDGGMLADLARPSSHGAEAIAFESRIAAVPDRISGITLIT
jgi:hypothetical protein